MLQGHHSSLLFRLGRLASSLVAALLGCVVSPAAAAPLPAPSKQVPTERALTGASVKDTDDGSAHELRGFQLDMSLGGGSAFGRAGSTTAPMSRLAPLLGASALVAGYRHQALFLGASFVGALGQPGGDAFPACADSEASCRVTVLRYGLQGRVYFPQLVGVQPWLGLGVGREVFALQTYTPTSASSLFANGTELLNVRFGLDHPTPSGLARLSAFADYGLGRFEQVLVDGEDLARDAPSRSHHWLLLGAGVSWMP